MTFSVRIATTTNMERRHILIFILSFIVLAGAGIVYLFIPKGASAPFLTPDPQPVPNPTPTGWKTYENKEFGFAFDYPGDWEISEDEGMNDFYKKYKKINLTSKGMPNELISINIYNNPQNLSVNDYFDIKYYDKGGVGLDPRAVEYTFSNNLKPVGNFYLYENDFYKIKLRIEKNKIYEFTILKGFNAEKIFDQILSTFKFIQT